MGWFDEIFAKKEESLEVSDSVPESAATSAQPAALPANEAAQAREAINRSAHEVLQRHGIPKSWVRFEILTLTDAGKVYFQLQVGMRHWDAYLLLHSWAFEQAVLECLRERSPAVAHALRAVLWHVMPTSGCPYEQLPPSVAWTSEAIEQRQNNVELFKAKKPREEVPADWQVHQKVDDFEPTLQMAHSSEEADAALQQILKTRQAR